MEDKQEGKKCIPDPGMQKRNLYYPSDICRFDDDFSGENIFPVRDSKIIGKLKKKCEEAKILWEATDQSGLCNLEGIFDQGDTPPPGVLTQHKQFLVYLHLAVSSAKLLMPKSRLKNHRSLWLEKDAIYRFYVDSFNKC